MKKTQIIEHIKQLSKDISTEDQIDLSNSKINEEEARTITAEQAFTMYEELRKQTSQEETDIIMVATISHLLLENLSLHLKNLELKGEQSEEDYSLFMKKFFK